MDDALTPLLWCGGIGWFLFTYLAALGGSMSAIRVLVWTVFYWLIALDAIATPFSIAASHIHHVSVGWRFVAFFVAFPYGLAVLRLLWLRAHRRTSSPPSPPVPPA